MSNESLLKIANKLGLDEASIENALKSKDSLPLVSFSGWYLSGKDTVALAVYKELGVAYKHLSFGSSIKYELNEIIKVLSLQESIKQSCKSIESMMNISINDGLILCNILLESPEGIFDGTLDAHQRTIPIRKALQYLGTEVRRAQDPNYWITQAQQEAVQELARGKAFVFTDVRFPDEAEGLKEIGAKIFRLTISRETQLRRLQIRDGINHSDPNTLLHPTETALTDNYPGFDAVIDNEREISMVVATVISKMQSNPINE